MPDSIPLKVLIIDDHPFIRSSIIKELETDSSYRVCGEAGSKAESLVMIDRHQPNFLIVDLSLEDGTGIEIMAYLQEHCPSCIPIVVSMHEEPSYIEQALQVGARGYIFKRESVQSVILGLKEVQQGRIFMSNRVSQVLINMHTRSSHAHDLDQLLSERELEIFEKIGEGYTRAQLADHFYISARTVDSHLERIKSKLKCTRMAHLSRLALQYHLAKISG